MDFFKIIERSKRNETEIFPDFQTGEVSDLLCRGKSFYAVWNEEKGMWSTNENDVQKIVDKALWDYVDHFKKTRNFEGILNVKTLKSDSSGMWNRFTNYTRRFPDSEVQLDSKLTFLNTKVKKTDYVSKRLNYAIEEGDHSAWDELVGKLYSPSEKEKIEWAIGAIVTGTSKDIEKFFVFYGDPGKGKGTIIKIIKKLFKGYCVTFDAKALGSSSDQFSMEVFKSNPLVAVDSDGNLSRIEDNTRLNKLVSHEEVVINEKGKSRYNATINCFIFVGSNHTVKITDGKSGIIRRLIDINPTGEVFKSKEYDLLMGRIDFELGAIAYHCAEVFKALGKNYYKNYIPQEMIMKTDVFYNFVEANLDIFAGQSEGMSLKQAYSMYKEYCDDALVEFKLPMYKFREELKNYYENFEQRAIVDGKPVRSWYTGFLKEKLEPPVLKKEEKPLPIVLDQTKSLLDSLLADCPAQYAKEDGSPEFVWDQVTTVLRDLDTSKVHYVLTQKYDKNLIFVDFDLKNKKGEKDVLLNMEAASKFPPTYTEFSKGGCGLHLYYIYDGDVDKLKSVYTDGIEVKVMKGKSATRRRVSKCNDLPVAHLAVGALPLKEEKMIDTSVLKDEKHLRNLIKKCLRKGNHGATRPEIDLISKALEDAYEGGMMYDVSDLQHDILVFAMNSTHQSEYCVKKVNEMRFRCREAEEIEEKTKKEVKAVDGDGKIAFFDVEVFSNLFIVNWKIIGPENKVNRMINPTPRQIEDLFIDQGNREEKLLWVGFNCRKYDNHIVYGRYLGLTNEQLFDLSQRIIVEGARDAFYPEAYNLSYTDILDFASKKQSLKKWEIELGIHHQELGLPWDKPVPEELWNKVAEYCDNDVIATEAVWNARQADFTARRILADIAGGTVNDTTNQLSTRFIFGDNKKPQNEFNYRNMGVTDEQLRNTTAQYVTLETGKMNPKYDPNKASFPFISHWSDANDFDFEANKYTTFEDWHHIAGFENAYKPVFPGYKYEFGKSTYRGEVVGEGGYVYAEPGIYTNVALLDIASMHPSSIVAEELFGERYTARFKEILEARIAIKHKDFERAKSMLDGKLAKYLTDESAAKDLAGALKIVINSVYGLTSAKFVNPFRDPRNVDNIVAKRGALFMVNLKHEVQKQGFTVAHIKTDSIKIPNATPDIIQFVMDYGKMYGYNFEHEATYDRMCLVNDAVYIARYDNGEWTATGAQFQQPYIFKTLFSGEPVEFADLCETKSVTGGAIYLDMNEKLDPQELAEVELEKRRYNEAHPDKQKKLNSDYSRVTDEDLLDIIASAHDYRFVGRAGLFTPIRPGYGGGIMVREKDGKYYSVTGTKGYRWLEAEVVQQLHKEDEIDKSYHEELVNDAIFTINKYGSFEKFIDVSKPYDAEDDSVPWSTLPPVVPCGDAKYNTCLECPNCKDDICKRGYSLNAYIEKGVH